MRLGCDDPFKVQGGVEVAGSAMPDKSLTKFGFFLFCLFVFPLGTLFPLDDESVKLSQKVFVQAAPFLLRFTGPKRSALMAAMTRGNRHGSFKAAVTVPAG